VLVFTQPGPGADIHGGGIGLIKIDPKRIIREKIERAFLTV
jgi:hypothetical protein